MDISLKQRLVGAVVLIGLGVIFIPMILDGSGRSARVTMDVAIPPEPVFKGGEPLLPLPPEEPPQVSTEVPAAQEPVPPPPEPTVSASTRRVSEARAVPESPAPETPAPPPAKPSAPEQSAWVVQVGAFGEQAKAIALRDRLRKAGFPAFVEDVRVDGKRVHRVKVGPELDRTKAQSIQARLAKDLQLEGIVVSHP